jgi:glycosyltransferase involved in cell wall biosynthesis
MENQQNGSQTLSWQSDGMGFVRPPNNNRQVENEKRRVLLLSPTLGFGGAEMYMATVAREVESAGWRSAISFSPCVGTEKFHELCSVNQLQYLPARIADGGWHTKECRLPRSWLRQRRVKELVRSFEPSLLFITLPSPNHGLPILRCAYSLRLPTIVVFQLVPDKLVIGPALRGEYAEMAGRMQWIAISRNTRTILAREFGVSESSINVIYNGSLIMRQDISETPRNICRQELLRSLGLSDGARLILTAARFDYQKGHDLIAPAVCPIVREMTDVHFVWAGSGPAEKQLRRSVRQFDLGSNIHFLGWREDIRKLMKACDLFLIPTRFEGGCPIVLMEAMENRIPVVTSDASGITEIVQDGMHGRVFRKNDVQDLRTKLQWVLTHREEMANMADSAFSHVQGFSTARMIEETVALMNRAVASSGR